MDDCKEAEKAPLLALDTATADAKPSRGVTEDKTREVSAYINSILLPWGEFSNEQKNVTPSSPSIKRRSARSSPATARRALHSEGAASGLPSNQAPININTVEELDIGLDASEIDDDEDYDHDGKDEGPAEQRDSTWTREYLERLVYQMIIRYRVLCILLFLAGISLVIMGLFVWPLLSYEAWISIVVTMVAVLLLSCEVTEAASTFITVLSVLMVSRVITVAQAFEGYSNPLVLAIAFLFVVAKGVEESTALRYLVRYVLGKPQSLLVAQVRLLIPVAVVSAFMNNTGLVAIMIPVVQSWCRSTDLPPSQLLMPLSFGTILGGMCTIIGTSTNLLVVALDDRGDIKAGQPVDNVNIFEIGMAAVPIAVVGLLYMLIFSRFLLPKTTSTAPEQYLQEARKYTTALRVPMENSTLVGKNINQAGLQSIKDVTLFEIWRSSEVIPAPSDDVVLMGGDILFFCGPIGVLHKALYSIEDLEPVEKAHVAKIPTARDKRILVEAVISKGSALRGHTITQLRFHKRYEAVVIAVHRKDKAISSSIGDIELRAGDGLLLEAAPKFFERHRYDRDFGLLSIIEGSGSVLPPHKPYHALLAAAGVLFIAVSSATNFLSLSESTLCVCIAFHLTGLLTIKQSISAISMPTLVVMASAIGVAKAITVTNVAQVVSDNLISICKAGGEVGILTGLYLSTALLCNVISPSAAVTLMYPIATVIQIKEGISEKGILYTVMLAGSTSFLTPFSYNTNLMITPIAGYRTVHYLKFGTPLVVLTMIGTVGMCYGIWEVWLPGDL